MVSRENYLRLLPIYHEIRPYLAKPKDVTKEYLLKKYPKEKKLVNEIWECIFELKLVWPQEIADRIFID